MLDVFLKALTSSKILQSDVVPESMRGSLMGIAQYGGLEVVTSGGENEGDLFARPSLALPMTMTCLPRRAWSLRNTLHDAKCLVHYCTAAVQFGTIRSYIKGMRFSIANNTIERL